MFLWNIAVTSLAEVWIEIIRIMIMRSLSASLPLRKCGLKLWFFSPIPVYGHRHFPCGSVDWNTAGNLKRWHSIRHFPCGSVDWNKQLYESIRQQGRSLPLRKCGLKLPEDRSGENKLTSLPLRKCGLKLSKCVDGHYKFGHFPCGSVDWNCIPLSTSSL